MYVSASQVYLRLKHDFCKLLPLLCGEALLLELFKTVCEPFPLFQAAQLAGLHRHATTVGVLQVRLNLLHQGLGFTEMTETLKKINTETEKLVTFDCRLGFFCLFY